MLIVGEPGSGKSRLIEEFHARLRDTPHTWVEWSCSQLLQNTPLHPIADWGRQRFGGADIPAEQRLADLENTLALIKLDPAENVPLLAPLLDIPLPPERVPGFGARGIAAPAIGGTYQLGDGRRTDSAGGAGSRRCALGRSDHTRPSARHRRTRCAGALVRSHDRPARVSAALGHALASRHDFAGAARPLSGATTWSRSLPPATRCRSEVVDGVTERTGGVPLFVEEVTRLLLERGEQGGIQAIPPTLQQSLTARLDRLGPAREVAQIGSVIGRDFSYAPAARRGRNGRTRRCKLRWTGSPRPTSCWCRACRRDSDYRFKHALIQDAAYENLLKSRRQVLHRRVAETLRDKFAGTAAAEPELLAHHFTQAGLTEAAIEWWGKAGQRSLERSALVEALRPN